MSSNKQYYKDINLIRLLACIAILLYHLNILKGGYLAVCVFFVLSGYLSCISSFKKEKFSIVSYYYNRFLKLYLPLLIVVFLTIFIITLFPNITWLNLKPEATSVLLGYNNFWQISTQLDYFSKFINSPFVHFWYIAILLQFDLIFPFIYLFFKKIGDKFNKLIPCIILSFISIISVIFFYHMSLEENIMITYYNTFARLFSLLFGVSLGFVHSYYKPLIFKLFKKEIIRKIIFYIYMLTLTASFILIDANSKYFVISMILVSLITCRLIDYSIINEKQNLTIFDKILKNITDISYEIYLVQYPIIYLFQYLNIQQSFKLIIIFFLIILISYTLHFCLNKSTKLKIPNYILKFIVICLCINGSYKYIIAKDHTSEMNSLKEQLNQNEILISIKQKEYAEKSKQENDDWLTTLENLENDENKLGDIVTNLNVVGIGDSVMLGAIANLYDTFPNGYFDAQVSRSILVMNDIIENLKNKNILGNTVIINLGANGNCSEKQKISIIESLENRDIFWINVTNDSDVHINSSLVELAKNYDNLHIIDWNSISQGHLEYFYADGIHLTPIGRIEYTKAIYDAIYNVYLEKYQTNKKQIIEQHENEQKEKISFYGNDILLNAFDYIKDNFNDANFSINSDFNYQELSNEINKAIKNDTLTYKIVFAFDNSSNLKKNDYKKLLELCENHEIYILSSDEKTNKFLKELDFNNVTILDFYQEIKKNNDYLMADKIHLTNKGNKKLNEFLKKYIK